MTKSSAENEKQLAAAAALDWVKDGMNLGLGSGSTAEWFIRLLAQRLGERKERVNAIATSQASSRLAAGLGIPLIQPRRGLVLDLTVDGADEVGPGLILIKGGGGALLREKVVARASKFLLIIGDSSKPKEQLGAFPLPLEVVPFAVPWVLDEVEALHGNPKVRMREAEPVLSDQGNQLIDCAFGTIPDPAGLAVQLEAVPGIVEHGLFLGLAKLALIGEGQTVRELL